MLWGPGWGWGVWPLVRSEGKKRDSLALHGESGGDRPGSGGRSVHTGTGEERLIKGRRSCARALLKVVIRRRPVPVCCARSDRAAKCFVRDKHFHQSLRSFAIRSAKLAKAGSAVTANVNVLGPVRRHPSVSCDEESAHSLSRSRRTHLLRFWGIDNCPQV